MLKKEKLRQLLKDQWYYIAWILGSFLLTVILEWIQLKSFTDVLHFMDESTKYFLVNFGIILASMSCIFITRSKVFTFSLITLIWGFFALVNAIVSYFRGTPLMFGDIFLVEEAFKLSDLYFTPMMMIGFIIVIVILVVVLFFLWRLKSNVQKVDYLVFVIVLLGAFTGLYTIERRDLMKPIQSNYIKSYQTYGFSYSILNSIYPYLSSNEVVYNEEMEAILETLTSYVRPLLGEENEANLIVVQLESFMDPLLIKGAEYSADPIAGFRALAEVSPNGYITVPTFGAGTVMTEFEVLTSVSMSALKPGEIPYDQLLCTTPIQSLATIFNARGYQTTFLHNYEGNFYNRHVAIGNLGFDTYVPLEYMEGDHGVHQIDQTDDSLLFDYVIQALEQSEELDFIYAVTAGTHQPYSTTEGENAEIIVSGDINPEYKLPLQDYVNRMRSLDEQIQRIVNYINQSDEATLLVFFSDHLPNLGAVTDEETYHMDLYQTPYLIYSNFELESVEPYLNMTSYQLGSYALNLLGIDEGAMHKIHDIYSESDNYQSMLDIVQKDLLYGEGWFYENKLLPASSNLFFGLGDLNIESVEETNEALFVHGTGFSSESRVYLDEQEMTTTFISSQLLQIDLPNETYQTITIKQHSGLDQAIGQGARMEIN